jgi:hypothetical protein
LTKKRGPGSLDAGLRLLLGAGGRQGSAAAPGRSLSIFSCEGLLQAHPPRARVRLPGVEPEPDAGVAADHHRFLSLPLLKRPKNFDQLM